MLTYFVAILFQTKKVLFNLVGHAEQVNSVDFHPRKANLLCSCDVNDEIKLWNVKESTCFRSFKVSLWCWNKMMLNYKQVSQNLWISSSNGSDFEFVMVQWQGATRQVRFQCRQGNLLAAATGNVINLIDVETGMIQHRFEVRLTLNYIHNFTYMN